jgi:hypothetical protein
MFFSSVHVCAGLFLRKGLVCPVTPSFSEIIVCDISVLLGNQQLAKFGEASESRKMRQQQHAQTMLLPLAESAFVESTSLARRVQCSIWVNPW